MLSVDNEQVIEDLKKDSEKILAYVRSLSEPVWNFKPGPERWSIKEILGHLADVDDKIYLPRLKRIVAEQYPFLPSIDQEELVRQGGHQEQSSAELMARYKKARQATIQFLQSTSDSDWERTGQHEEYGKLVFGQIVRERMRWHDQKHLEQIKRNVAAFGGR